MKKTGIVLAIAVLILTGCGKQEGMPSGQQNSNENAETLIIASFGENAELSSQIDEFNNKNTRYKIEMVQYSRSDQPQEDGIARLQREIISGKGPDLINFGNGYRITDILGRYTEDLTPYLEAYSQDSSQLFYDNIMDAFRYQNQLYVIPVSFRLETYAGRRSMVGDRKSWTIDEMAACYQQEYGKSNGTLMLYPGETKIAVFGSLLTGNIGNFVDWENGTCSFNERNFRKIMEFSNGFPDQLVISEEFSPMSAFADGKALLYPLNLSNVYDISKADLILGEEAVLIGYPVNGTDGTVIQPGELMFAISAVSRHKEAAWEFIVQFLNADIQNNISNGFPVNKNVMEAKIAEAGTMQYEKDGEGNQIPVVKDQIVFKGEDPIKIYQISEKQSVMLRTIIEKASVASSYDGQLHSILLEEVQSYFSNDKTLEEASEVMQGRGTMLIGEAMK